MRDVGTEKQTALDNNNTRSNNPPVSLVITTPAGLEVVLLYLVSRNIYSHGVVSIYAKRQADSSLVITDSLAQVARSVSCQVADEFPAQSVHEVYSDDQ